MYELPGVHPFDLYDGCWAGKILSVDGASAGDFTRDDLDVVIWAYETADGWDGEVAAICMLKDGRYISWETFWGPTGDGFHGDAYGGDADITAATTFENILQLGLTPERRELCKKELGIK